MSRPFVIPVFLALRMKQLRRSMRAAPVWLIMLGVALCAPNWLPGVGAERQEWAATVQAVLSGLCFWLLWFALWARLWMGTALAVILFLPWVPLELYLRSEMHTEVNAAFVGVLAESNWGEWRDFASSFQGVWLPAVLMVIVLGSAVVGSTRRADLRWVHRSRWWVLATFIPLGAGLSVAFALQDDDAMTLAVSREDRFDSGIDNPWSERWQSVFPFNVPFAINAYVADQRRVADLRQALANRHLKVAPTGQYAAEVIVFVIGESARADRWGLAGYRRQTNPLLAQQPHLVFFRDVVTHSTSTRLSVPSMLSRQPVLWPNGALNEHVEPSFLRALADAGYATHWISNQAASGYFDTSSLFYARDAQNVEFLNPGSYKAQGSLDEVLLRSLSKALRTAGKSAVILHTLGSHFNYAHRYPPAFDLYTPSLKTVAHEMAFGPEHAEAVNNAYDNSIRYSDFVLSRVIDEVKATHRPAAVVYVADHGEDVYEPGCQARSLTRRAAVSFRVPAFVWLSDELIARRPLALQALRSNAEAPWQTDFVFGSVLDLAGLMPGDGSLGANVLATQPRVTADRLIAVPGGKVANFDAALKANACLMQ